MRRSKIPPDKKKCIYFKIKTEGSSARPALHIETRLTVDEALGLAKGLYDAIEGHKMWTILSDSLAEFNRTLKEIGPEISAAVTIALEKERRESP